MLLKFEFICYKYTVQSFLAKWGEMYNLVLTLLKYNKKEEIDTDKFWYFDNNIAQNYGFKNWIGPVNPIGSTRHQFSLVKTL